MFRIQRLALKRVARGGRLPGFSAPSVMSPVLQLSLSEHVREVSTSRSPTTKKMFPTNWFNWAAPTDKKQKIKHELVTGEIYYGGWKDDKFHGHGTLISPYGDTYEGEFVNGMKHGKGTMKYASGNVYTGDFFENKVQGEGKQTYFGGGVCEGEWVDGLLHGAGTWMDPSGDKYVGNWKSGQYHGFGTYYYANGDIYEGMWDSGQFAGLGEMKYKSGARYVGGWQQDQFHGYGDLLWANGDRYQGEFQRGKRHGRGRLSSKTNETIYEGQFKDDFAHGQGKFHWQNGDVYEGSFVRGEPHGEGRCVYANGDIYVGDWKHNQRQGLGKAIFGAGGYYLGDWFEGNMSGQGLLVDREGNLFEGIFREGKLTGNDGVAFFVDGRLYEGSWRDGKPHGYGVMKYGLQKRKASAFDEHDPEDVREDISALLGYERGEGAVGGSSGWHALVEEVLEARRKKLSAANNKYSSIPPILSQAANSLINTPQMIDIYQGQFFKGERDDEKGVFRSRDGSVYTGGWKNDQRSGRGRVEMGEVIMEGTFVKDQQEGKGVMIFKGSNRMIPGVWREGKMYVSL